MAYELEYKFQYVDVNDQEHEVSGIVVLDPETEPSYNMTHDILVGWSIDDFICDDKLMQDVYLDYIRYNLEDEVLAKWEDLQSNYC